ncbi:MAG: protein kinase domain-containing protein [Phycisphaerales bacterium]
MNTDNWTLVCTCFEHASQLAPDEREAYLASLPTKLRNDVHKLLDADIDDDFLDSGVRVSDLISEPQSSARIGMRIGDFTIIRELSRGGTSIVYEATQAEPARPVALKVLRSAFSDAYAKRRFLEEAATLAKLRHPGIAQVYESGHAVIGDEEVLYLAVEFIPDALDIVTYAERQSLDLKSSLALFASACDALAHGHAKGFIHRDLKPANLLVDTEGSVKVIDFGIARATGQSAGVTLPGDFLGTPQFMSPEQAAGDPSSVDVRTDVYSLGVVLYRLLTGALPYTVDPSRAFDTGRIIAQARVDPPSQRNASISRDLEAVVLKSLAYEINDRYVSVADLKADVERILASRPVLARHASALHRLRLSARRNPLAACLAALLTIAVGISVVGAVYGVQNITRQRDAASETAQVLSDILSSPRVAREGLNAKVVDTLDDAVSRIDASRADPAVRIRLLETVAKSFEAAGDFRRTLDIRRRLLRELIDLEGPNHPDVLSMRVLLAESLYDSGEVDQARAEFERLIEEFDDFSTDPLLLARLRNNLGLVMLDSGENIKAEELFAEVISIRSRHLSDDHPDVAATMFNLGICRYRRSEIPAAIESFTNHLGMIERTLGADHREAAAPRRMLAQCHLSLGRLDDARAQATAALEIATNTLGSDHPETGTMAVSLARVERAAGDTAVAIRLFDQALDAYRKSLGEDHSWYQSVKSEREKLTQTPVQK